MYSGRLPFFGGITSSTCWCCFFLRGVENQDWEKNHIWLGICRAGVAGMVGSYDPFGSSIPIGPLRYLGERLQTEKLSTNIYDILKFYIQYDECVRWRNTSSSTASTCEVADLPPFIHHLWHLMCMKWPVAMNIFEIARRPRRPHWQLHPFLIWSLTLNGIRTASTVNTPSPCGFQDSFADGERSKGPHQLGSKLRHEIGTTSFWMVWWIFWMVCESIIWWNSYYKFVNQSFDADFQCQELVWCFDSMNECSSWNCGSSLL